MESKRQLRKAINEVQTLDINDLRCRFVELFGADVICPQNPQNIRDRIVYRLQELHYGGICEADRKILEEMATHRVAKTIKTQIHRKYLSPGVRLIRQWNGINHEVVVRGENSFEYDGVMFNTLTAVAKFITGTHWNGNTFFGVLNEKREKHNSVRRVLPEVGGGRTGARL